MRTARAALLTAALLGTCQAAVVPREQSIATAARSLSYASLKVELLAEEAERAKHGVSLLPLDGVVTQLHGIAQPVVAPRARKVVVVGDVARLRVRLHDASGSRTLPHATISDSKASVTLPVSVADGGALTLEADGKVQYTLPVLQEVWECGSASKKCSTADADEYVGCVLRGHARCVEDETSAEGFGGVSVETADRIVSYLTAHGAQRMNVRPFGGKHRMTLPGATGAVRLTYVDEALEAKHVAHHVVGTGSDGVTVEAIVPREMGGVLVARPPSVSAGSEAELLDQMWVAAFDEVPYQPPLVTDPPRTPPPPPPPATNPPTAPPTVPTPAPTPTPTRPAKTPTPPTIPPSPPVGPGGPFGPIGPVDPTPPMMARKASVQDDLFSVTWEVRGCLQLSDNLLHGSAPAAVVRPLSGVRVAVTSSVYGLIYYYWGAATTDAAGCFHVSRKFNFIQGRLPRHVRVLVRMQGPNSVVMDRFEAASSGSKSIVLVTQRRTRSERLWNMGVRTLAGNDAPAGAWEGERHQVLREQGIIMWGTERLHEVLTMRGGAALGMTNKVSVNYPALPGAPAAMGNQVFLPRGSFSIRTVFRQLIQVWHAQHTSGNVHQKAGRTRSHSCQVREIAGFLEGFADYAVQHLLNDVFNVRADWQFGGFSLRWLANHPRCIDEGVPGLTTAERLYRNYNGTEHALHLLTDDRFYQRNYQLYTPRAEWSAGLVLRAECEWYPSVQLTFFDVLRAFLPGPGVPSYASDEMDLLGFYRRVQLIHGLPQGWIDDRVRFHNPAEAQNPASFCRQRCTAAATFYNPNRQVGVALDPVRGACRLNMAMPAEPFVLNNQYYAGMPNCPPGATAGAWRGCRYNDPIAPGVYGGRSLSLWVSVDADNARVVGLFIGLHSCPVGTTLVSNAQTPPGAHNFPAIVTCAIRTSLPGSLSLVGGNVVVEGKWHVPTSASPVYIHTVIERQCASGTFTDQGCLQGAPPSGAKALLIDGHFFYS